MTGVRRDRLNDGGHVNVVLDRHIGDGTAVRAGLPQLLRVNSDDLGSHADEWASDRGARVTGRTAWLGGAWLGGESKLRGDEVRSTAQSRAGSDIHRDLLLPQLLSKKTLGRPSARFV
jgi:hypothetical protein